MWWTSGESVIIKGDVHTPLKFSTCLHYLSGMLKGKRQEFCCAGYRKMWYPFNKEAIFFLKTKSKRITSTKHFSPYKGIQLPKIWKYFACEIWNLRKFCLWNSESLTLESGIKLKESGIQVPLTKTGIHGMECGVPCMGRKRLLNAVWNWRFYVIFKYIYFCISTLNMWYIYI